MSCRYFTLKQAAKRLGVSVRSVRRYISAGLIPAKAGPHSNSSLRINSFDLAAFDNQRGREFASRGGRLYTLNHSAALLGVSTTALRRRIEAGLITTKRGIYPNSPILVSDHELAAYDRYRSGERRSGDCRKLDAPFLSLQSAAKEIGISASTLRRRLHDYSYPLRREPYPDGKILLGRRDVARLSHTR